MSRICGNASRLLRWDKLYSCNTVLQTSNSPIGRNGVSHVTSRGYSDFQVRYPKHEITSHSARIVLPLLHEDGLNTILNEVRKSASTIRSIEFLTTDNPLEDEFNPFCEELNERVLRPSMPKALNLVRGLPNLEDVHVFFSPFSAPPEITQWGKAAEVYIDWTHNSYNMRTPQDTGRYRADVLRTLFSALAESKPPRFTGLWLSNLQDYDDQELVASAPFGEVLGRLREFHVSVAEEDSSEVCSINAMLSPTRHAWWKAFPSTWLAPLQQNVESVSITSSLKDSVTQHWGLYPKCDLRSIHFGRISKCLCCSIIVRPID